MDRKKNRKKFAFINASLEDFDHVRIFYTYTTPHNLMSD